MKEQFKKRKNRADFGGRDDAPRQDGGFAPRAARGPQQEAPRFEGGEGPPRRNTYRREGAVGGWSRPFQRSDRPERPDRDRSYGDRSGGHGDRPHYDRAPSSFERPANFDRSGPRFDRQDRGSPRPFNDRPRGAPPFPPRSAPPAAVVSVRDLKEGIVAANRGLAQVMEQFGHGVDGDYDISALEATVSFDAQGKFMGFGRGGAASFTITLTPLEAESVVLGDGPATDDAATADASEEDIDVRFDASDDDEDEDEDDAADDEAGDDESDDEEADDEEADDDEEGDDQEGDDTNVEFDALEAADAPAQQDVVKPQRKAKTDAQV